MTDSTVTRSRLNAFGWRDILAIGSLWGLVLLFFWGIAGAGRVLASGDVFTYFYPYWAAATRAFETGRLPLWNQNIFLGVPFLANSQAGTLYPLNWVLWKTLPAFVSVHVTIVAHLCLAALSSYLWARLALRLRPVGAWTSGALFALGGYLGAQVEHINQLQGLAWLPLALLLVDVSTSGSAEHARRRRLLGGVGLSVVVGLILLAGHTQTAFISLVGLGVYAAMPAVWRAFTRRAGLGATSRELALRVGLVTAAAAVGAALAAAQLLPTAELSRLSVRAGGLPLNERLSFSVSPIYFGRALMPGYVIPVRPDHLEHVAYIGVIGLALVASALKHLRFASLPVWSALGLLVLGLFFALGLFNPLYVVLVKYLPGFAYFRVPARWLALYVLGAAGLAGWGAETLWQGRLEISPRDLLWLASILIVMVGWAALGVRFVDGRSVPNGTLYAWIAAMAVAGAFLVVSRRAPRAAAYGLLACMTAELFAARATLPYAQATAPQAFTSIRPAIAQLWVGEPGRFLSLSDITFDPGDLDEIRVAYGPQLTDGQLYAYIVATKEKEVLSPNLSMVFDVSSLDGYDGGLLPLARYVKLEQLFLPADRISTDGRLREKLSSIPEGRWLDLFNVRYLITDKLRDAWLDDVFYDLQMGARLSRGEAADVAYIPGNEANALGIVSYLNGAAAVTDGSVVGSVEIRFADGAARTFELRAGEQTAEGVYTAAVSHAQAEVGGHFWPDQPEGCDYVARLRWAEPATPTSIRVQAVLGQGELVIRGLSLIDERTGTFESLVISDQGPYRLVDSGDVKIYENLDVLPRAFVVHSAVAADDEAALAMMRDASFDPATQVVLATGSTDKLHTGKPVQRGDSVRIVRDTPELVELAVDAAAPGYLVLTDAWYPGWQATIDGRSVPIDRADILFRALPLAEGSHRVRFVFRPASFRMGVAISLVALLAVALAAAGASLQAMRRLASAR